MVARRRPIVCARKVAPQFNPVSRNGGLIEDGVLDIEIAPILKAHRGIADCVDEWGDERTELT